MKTLLSQSHIRISQRTGTALIMCLTLGLSQTAFSEGGGLVTDDPESLSAAARTQPYSPYAQRNFPSMPLWGDTHLHTAISFDAGAFGARLLPPDAYRFARGEEVVSSTGQPVKLSRPLDFLVVADHSDNMGFFPQLLSGNPSFLADPTGRRWYNMIQAGGQEAVQVAVEVIQNFSKGTFPEALWSAPGTTSYRDTWEQIIQAADEMYSTTTNLR